MGMHTVHRVGHRVAAALAVLTTSVVLLTGCGSGGSTSVSSQPAVAPGPAQVGAPEGNVGAPRQVEPAADKAGTPLTVGAGRQIARTASLTLVVQDVRATADQIRGVAQSLEGWVAYESLQVDAQASDASLPSGSLVTISVPASRLDAATERVAALGVVRNRGTSAEDVTQVVVDVDARIRSLEASVARLQELVGRAGSVADIAAVERELSNRQAELESLKSQRLQLAGAVERSTLTVSLLTPTQSTTTNPLQTGWARGWTAFLESVAILVTVVAAVLPFAAVAALVVVPIVWWRRRASARGGRREHRRGADRQEGADDDAHGEGEAERDPEGAVGEEDQRHGGEGGDEVAD